MPPPETPARLPVFNVASVPQRSPFRYPGGKTWLVPYVRLWLAACKPRPSELIEPFAGGAIVGLTAAFEGLVQRVVLVEKDQDVAAVWQTILDPEQAAWLADAVAAFQPTPESVRAALAPTDRELSLRERAFRTLLRNRVQRGGILAPGAGLLKLGENRRGLASRWYPQTLRRRILAIARCGERIRFRSGDGLQVLRENQDRPEVAFFIDPPYTTAGRRLYTHSEVDHPELFRLAAGLRGDFLMSYDDAPEIRRLAAHCGFALAPVPMKSTHHAVKFELLIGRNLDWLAGLAASPRRGRGAPPVRT